MRRFILEVSRKISSSSWLFWQRMRKKILFKISLLSLNKYFLSILNKHNYNLIYRINEKKNRWKRKQKKKGFWVNNQKGLLSQSWIFHLQKIEWLKKPLRSMMIMTMYIIILKWWTNVSFIIIPLRCWQTKDGSLILIV